MTKAKVLLLQKTVNNGKIDKVRAFWTLASLEPIAREWIKEVWRQPPLMFTVEYYVQLLLRDARVDMGETTFSVDELEVE